MKITTAQFHWLQWLDANGGVGRVVGSRIAAGNEKSSNSAALPFLNLICKGYIAVTNGELIITGNGIMAVHPFRKQA